MIKKKICIIGEFGVGKTSIVERYVNDRFAMDYLSTIGVSIQKVHVNDYDLIIWDIAGEQDGRPINMNYLRGLSGYVIVCDICLGNFAEIIREFTTLVEENIGVVPFVILLNKIDKIEETSPRIEIEIAELKARGYQVFLSSAKTGQQIHEAFLTLLDEIIAFDQEQYGHA